MTRRDCWKSRARNALELLRFGQLGEPYSSPFEVVDEGPHHALRQYTTPGARSAVILIPPLMVMANVYDIAPDVSPVTALSSHGIEPFVVDFGAPEQHEGGMKRTLDDHIRAVSRCIDVARKRTGKDVHLCGYSQGGMFAYQTAALRRGDGVASLVTFGSPVDLHRGLPAIRSDVTSAIAELIEPAVSSIVTRIEGLPSKLTSTGFKVISGRKEYPAARRLRPVAPRLERARATRGEAAISRRRGVRRVAWPRAPRVHRRLHRA